MSRSTKLFVCTKVLFTLTTPTAYDMYYPFAGSTVYNYLEPSTSITPPVASTLVPPPPPPKNRCSMASFGFNRSLGDHVNARSTKSFSIDLLRAWCPPGAARPSVPRASLSSSSRIPSSWRDSIAASAADVDVAAPLASAPELLSRFKLSPRQLSYSFATAMIVERSGLDPGTGHSPISRSIMTGKCTARFSGGARLAISLGTDPSASEIFHSWSRSSFPGNSGLPPCISTMMHPRLHTSTAQPYGSPNITSGAR
eukprot:29339-Pelagococcus_subviridis.AAC.9